jgi:hypothetical protein
MGCDTGSGSCVACVAAPAGATDLYVDATSFAGGTGTDTCPFTTITAAIKARAALPTVKTIHVAPGKYAAGESFPLQVRGFALIGAGADSTIVEGEGTYDHSVEGGQFPYSTLNVSVITGAHDADSTIRGISVKPVVLSTAADLHIGVMCDRGNLVDVYTPGTDAKLPPPNTLLDDVTIQPGYGRTMMITTTSTSLVALPYESGCNVKIIGSKFMGGPGSGIWALGAGNDDGNGHKEHIVAAELGEDGKQKNLLTGYTNANGNAFALMGWDHVFSFKIANTAFESNDWGLAITQHAGADPYVLNKYELRTSTFTKITQRAAQYDGNARLTRFEDNTFTDVTNAQGTAVGLYLGIANSTVSDATAPGVLKARRNKFVGNDNGVVYGYDRSTAPEIKFSNQDWGTAADKGSNVFRCNSSNVAAAAGYDVRVQGSASNPMLFVGNAWDHAPVVTASLAEPRSAANATDLTYKAGVIADVSFATVATDACPQGRTP